MWTCPLEPLVPCRTRDAMSTLCTVAMDVSVQSASRETERRSTDYPYNCRRKQGQKYMNGQTDICTHIQGPMALQGRDRALARRVQNQDLVQGLV